MRTTSNARLTLGERVKRAALDIKVIMNITTMCWFVRFARNAMHDGATALLQVTGILRYGRGGHEHHASPRQHHAHVKNTARLGLPRYYNILFHRMGYRVTTIVTGIAAGRAVARAKKNWPVQPQGQTGQKKMGAEAPKVNPRIPDSPVPT